MSAEEVQEEEVLVSPRKRGLIRFNPKYTHSNPNAGDAPSSTGFSKPRKYFDSADFFMHEELKNKDGEKNVHACGEKQSQGSALASECLITNGSASGNTDSPDTNKNVVPLILLRRSKTSAVISSYDGADVDPENLPTTVEVLNGPSNREIPPPRPPSADGSREQLKDERFSRRSVTVCGENPALEAGEYDVRSPEEIRALLLSRSTAQPDDTSVAGAAAMVSPAKVVGRHCPHRSTSTCELASRLSQEPPAH